MVKLGMRTDYELLFGTRFCKSLQRTPLGRPGNNPARFTRNIDAGQTWWRWGVLPVVSVGKTQDHYLQADAEWLPSYRLISKTLSGMNRRE